ncbi:MAG: cytochrome b [Gammaproteobacteria bacterium]|nr:MAG: cytochrome b [Gammaproteobacteria bacterium]
MDTQQQLSPITRALHWLVALTIITMLAVGFYMATYEVWSLYPIHKAFGVLALLIILPRILWRLKNGWPTPVRDYPTWEHKLALATHWILILGTIIMPISGFIFSGAGGYGVDVFGFVIAPANHNPANPNEVIPFNAALSNAGHETHELVGYLMVIAIVLHVAGALKHLFKMIKLMLHNPPLRSFH